MARVNLTLDDDTFRRLERHARRLGKPKARAATEVLKEGLTRHESAERRAKLARDYAAQRRDGSALVRDLERAQLDLLGDEDE
jgi:hypothetical protein